MAKDFSNLEMQGLANEISLRIVNQTEEFSKLFNAELINLFRSIGDIFNKYEGNSYNESEVIPNILALSRFLVQKGVDFNEKELKYFSMFSGVCKLHPVLTDIGSYLSWEHIKHLILSNNIDEWFFYIKLSLRNALDGSQLKSLVESDQYKKGITNRTISNDDAVSAKIPMLADSQVRSFLHIELADLAESSSIIGNPFKDHSYSLLFALLNVSDNTTSLNRSITSDENIYDLENNVLKAIQEFSFTQNSWLNNFLNRFFWKIGSYLLKFESATAIDSHFFDNLEFLLKERYSDTFNKVNMQKMVRFAVQHPDIKIAAILFNIVTWDHIIELQRLHSIPAQMHYARIAAIDGLNPMQLTQLINKDVGDQENGFKQGDDDFDNVLLKIERTVVQDRVGPETTFQLEEILINIHPDLAHSLAINNILSNPYFLNLMNLPS